MFDRKVGSRVFEGLVLLAAVVSLQIGNGGYTSEFGAHPDEAAHYVTALMVFDYLREGIPEAPMAFATRFYEHYPKVALGNWPPGFYTIQSVWMLMFGVGTASVMSLMAAMQWCVAWVVFETGRRHLGSVYGWAAVAILLLVPLVQKYASMVMTEIPVALAMLLAALIYSRYMERSEWRFAIGFGLIASFAILVKGSGLALAAIPLLAPLLTRKWNLYKRASWWAAGVLVFIICFPWSWLTLDLARAGWEGSSPSWDFTSPALTYYPAQFFKAMGVIAVILAAIGALARLTGLFDRLTGTASTRIEPVWATLAALAAGVFGLHLVVPVCRGRADVCCSLDGAILADTHNGDPVDRGGYRAARLCD